jgi:soluble lytic murein transglycosylase-like protein
MVRRELAMAGVVALLASAAQAQIYTRRNSEGIIEATNVPDGPGYRLTYPGKGTLIHSRGWRRSYRGEYDRHIIDAAAHHGVSPDLVKAVIQVESEFDRLAVSSKGARGLMQLMPHTARRLGVFDAFDPRQNIFGGAQYLRMLLDLFQGDVSLALAGYNAGENAVARYRGIPPYKETRGYVQKVQGLLSGTPWRSQGRAAAPVIAYAPSGLFAATVPAARERPRKLTPARPAVYYKWRDAAGHVHVGAAPPGDGVLYSMIRALD